MRRLLIANRGEIACRIMRTAKTMGITTIALHGETESDALHVHMADEAIPLGPNSSYLDIPRIIEAARDAGADAIHPGYGFLSENADFSRACEAARILFVGPPPSAIAAMGGKIAAKTAVAKLGVSVLPWASGSSADELLRAAGSVGFPLMIKASAGGGGRGLRRVEDTAALERELPRVAGEAERAFGDGTLMLERALDGARHVEIQVFADCHGNVVHLGERDCSLQRRHQKVIEEAPAVDAALRSAMGAAAITATRSIGYVGAGTVEFLLAPDGKFYFLEMNTRLQVEHPVTEAITGLDLVRMQLEVARGALLGVTQDAIRYDGHAIEARLYAEDEHFVPQVGRILAWEIPAGVRVDHGLRVGQRVTSDYDAMLAKVIAHAPTRAEALEKLEVALRELVVHGVTTNRSLLLGLLATDAVRGRKVTTASFPPVTAAEPSRRFIAVAAAMLAGRPSIGYRVHGVARDWARFAIGETVFSAVVAGESVFLAENEEKVVRIGETTADVDGITARLVVSREREQLHITYAGETCTVRPLPLLEPRRAATAVRREVLAPMSGKVVSISARAGEHVDAGAILLVLEAMKMQHEVRAPQASRVRHVRAAAGGQVAARSVLVELDPEEGAP